MVCGSQTSWRLRLEHLIWEIPWLVLLGNEHIFWAGSGDCFPARDVYASLPASTRVLVPPICLHCLVTYRELELILEVSLLGMVIPLSNSNAFLIISSSNPKPDRHVFSYWIAEFKPNWVWDAQKTQTAKGLKFLVIYPISVKVQSQPEVVKSHQKSISKELVS